MNTAIVITAIICATVLVIVCIVKFVEYKLKNNNVLREVRDELKSIHTELEINNRWYGFLSDAFEGIEREIKELKNKNNNAE